MHELSNVEHLPPQVLRRVRPMVQELIELHGENIRSVFIYGSAAHQGYVPGVSDINLAVVFGRLDFGVFKKSLQCVTKAIPRKIAAPLFLTEEYIAASLDVFPIEFWDMQEQHVVVYGEDFLSSLTIQGEHVRLFCEQQIKGRLIRIRQAYLEVGLHSKGMLTLMTESLTSLLPVFRNLLRLRSVPCALDKTEILARLGKEFDLDSGVALTIYRHKTGREKIEKQQVPQVLEKYIDFMGKLAERVDRLS